MPTRDWGAIRDAYVQGTTVDGARCWPTLDDIGALFGIPVSTVRKVSMREQWPELRNTFRTSVEQQRRDETARTIAAAGAEVDVSAARAAARLIKHVEQHIDEAEKQKVPVPATTAHTLARTLGICQGVLALDSGKATSVIEQRQIVDLNASVRRARPVLERMSFAEIEAMTTSLAPYVRAQAEVDREARQDKPVH